MICRSENQNIIATNCCRWTHEFQLCSLCSRISGISWRFIEIVFLRVSPPRNCSSCPNLDKRRRNMRFPPGGQTFKRSLSRTLFPLGPRCLKAAHKVSFYNIAKFILNFCAKNATQNLQRQLWSFGCKIQRFEIFQLKHKKMRQFWMVSKHL